MKGKIVIRDPYHQTKWQRCKTFARASGVFIISGMLVSGAFWGGYTIGEVRGHVKATGTYLTIQRQDATKAWLEGYRSGKGGW